MIPVKATLFKGSTLGSTKFIFCNDAWCTPNELEAMGGKARNKNWKKSLRRMGKPLLYALALLPIKPSVASPSPSPGESSTSYNFLVNPVLAYIKVHRLRGDDAHLKNSLADKFDHFKQVSALKLIWDHCRSDLEKAGLKYTNRRSTDKVHLFDIILADLLVVFEGEQASFDLL